MIQSRTTSEILITGINQAVMHGAPPDVVANLRGALAFVRHGEQDMEPVKEPIINAVVPAAPVEGVINDE